MDKTAEIRGDEAYQRLLQQNQEWRERNPEQVKERMVEYPETCIINIENINRELSPYQKCR